MVFHRKSGPMPLEPQPAPVRREDRPQPRALPASAGHNSGSIEQSLIGGDLSIEGHAITIRCKGTLRVNGQIQADVHSRELEIGREAIITGSITAESVEVSGRINGAILSNKVTLHATAEVEGDIAAQYLSIEQGASFDGRSRRVRDPAEIVPQLEASAGQGGLNMPAYETTTNSSGSYVGHAGAHQAQPPMMLGRSPTSNETENA